ncbi:MAG: hypothetical protein K5634_07505 [Sphaerochaetaceae bacterium]|nr:hypothetical protein [Sphaerochaetaceae bacterium]
MRKTLILTVITLLMMIFLASCGTTVGINTLVPSVVNMTGYKTVAVASVKPYDGSWAYKDRNYPEIRYDQYTIPTPDSLVRLINGVDWSVPAEDTAEYITKIVEKGVDQGFYTVLGARTTDRLIRSAGRTTTVRQVLLDEKVDALVTGAVTDQRIRSYITAEVRTGADKRNSFYYYLNWSASLRYEYTVQDVNSLSIIDTYPFERSYSDSFLIGYLTPDGDFIFSSSVSNSTFDFSSRFRSMSDNFERVIRDRLTPHYAKSNLSLAANESKDESLEPGYKYAENNMYREACEVFEKHWNTYRDFVSGYNTAVLYYACGRPDEAITLANEVFKATGNDKALKLNRELVNLYETNKAGQAQVEGNKTTSVSPQQDVIL